MPSRDASAGARSPPTPGGCAGWVAACGSWTRALVVLTVTAVLVVRFTTLSARFGREPSRIAFPESLGDVRLSSYLVVGPLLVIAWGAMLRATRAYDARVLGVGSEEYRRVARASVYFWGLVAIASYMTQFELSRFVLGFAFLVGTFLLLLGRWTARKILHRARRRSDHLVAPGARGGWS